MLTAPAVTVPASSPARVVVLASGTGSLLQALLELDPVAGSVVAVGTDKACPALAIAAGHSVPGFTVALGEYRDRAGWDAALAEAIAAHEPDLIVAAGFMKILGPAVLGAFAGRIINAHPALLPAFPGAHAVPAALDYGVAVTGSTVHLVDAGLDTGPILAQRAVPVLPGDDESTLHERIKVVERELLVETVARVATGGYTLTGRKVALHD